MIITTQKMHILYSSSTTTALLEMIINNLSLHYWLGYQEIKPVEILAVEDKQIVYERKHFKDTCSPIVK